MTSVKAARICIELTHTEKVTYEATEKAALSQRNYFDEKELGLKIKRKEKAIVMLQSKLQRHDNSPGAKTEIENSISELENQLDHLYSQ